MFSLRSLTFNSSRARVLVFLTSLLPIPFLSGLIPIVTFPAEHIELSIHGKSVDVVGEYEYRNPLPFPVRQGFTVPLPIDDEHPIAWPVTLRRADTGEPIALIEIFGEKRFELTFPPASTIRVICNYSQPSPTHTARYILMTTRSWWQPIKHGRYTLRLAEHQTFKSNYPMTKTGEDTFEFERGNFMPDCDWKVAWEGG